MADQVVPKPGTSKIGEHEVQLKVGRPGTPQTWHLKIGEYEVQRKPGTSKIGEMRSNEKLADQDLPKPGT